MNPRLLYRLSLPTAAVLVAACSGAPTPDTIGRHLQAGEYFESRGSPDATLTDPHGKAFDIRAETAGKLGYVFFGYTSCPDICPITMNTLARALDRIEPAERERIVPIFITLDPDRDDPERVGYFVDAIGGGIVGLTGTEAELVGVLEQFGYVMPPWEKPEEGFYEVPHPADLFVLTPDGEVRFGYPNGVTPDPIVADARVILGIDW